MARQTGTVDRVLKSMDPAEAVTLNDFRCARQAEYRHGNRNRCLKGTRGTILDEIELWACDSYKAPVYWLNGLAGTGKSTIAQTIAERLFVEGRLGASFFCSRDFEDRSDLRFIFPTLAVQLARTHTEFRSILVTLVRSDPEVAHESLYGQMNRLIVQPLVESEISTVIVIDALDECKDDEPASAILSVLGQFVDQIPKVKFFVTGRPEPRIRNGFRLPLLAKVTDVFVLHDVEPGRVNSDIRLFYKHNCSEVKSRQCGLDDWPTEEQLDLLCERAAGLFIYAIATVRFIDLKNMNPRKQLDRLIRSQESGSEGKTKLGAGATLDSLYTTILREAFGDDDPENDPKVRSVLGAVILAANPLSPSAIAAILGFDDVADVYPLLSSVHSLLILQENFDHPVQPFHKSFPDYIVDPTRCTDSRFCVHPPDQHTELLIGCLELMNQRLERNMCKLPDGVINTEVKDLNWRAEQHIDKALEYACRSWHKHLNDTRPAQKLKITPILHQFLEEKFLCWLEVLSVLGATREAVDAMERIEKWSDLPRTLDLTRDYFRFVLTFFGVISTSAPHIYTSALPLSPQTSIVRELYEQHACPLTRVVQGLPTSWDLIPATMYHEHILGSVAWSQCNRFIAVAKSEVTEILDVATLERLNTFESHPPRNRSLSFSPDGHTLTQFYEEGLNSWDVQTGGPVGAVFSSDVDIDDFLSSAYSMDGKILAVSGSSYRDSTLTFTIVTYDLLSWTHTRSYHVPEGRIIPPIWTHGGCLRFATVKPGSIEIWEAEFTSVHTPAITESYATPDEIADIEQSHFLFLPALSQLAFAVQDTVSVWDVRDSRFLLKHGPIPTSEDFKMSFSSDGRLFSSTVGREIYVWKRSLPSYGLHQKLTFPSAGAEPLFSPNGESIVAAGHRSIRVWRTRDQILSPPNVPVYESHSSFILGFSPKNALSASVRLLGTTVTIRDLQSGDTRLTIDASMKIMYLRVTRSAVAVAGEGRVIIWNIPEENCVGARASVKDSAHIATLDLPGPHLYGSREESISADLSRIVVLMYAHDPQMSNRLQIHDTSTGRLLAGLEPFPHAYSHVDLGEHEVWCNFGTYANGWEVTEDRESGTTTLKPLSADMRPQQPPPWGSQCGYEVTQDGWVLSPTKKRLLWLPHHWRSSHRDRIWSGRFLGLKHNGLPEAVILEFLE
ncbi:hypothetical protein BJ322DRAFT_775253 [Thelephora terrestris]|uniref:NACHT domain-containing protein n=1 Tax=Thelephora terrestris TaxID=56493 RepID=A0A9P6HGG5_9AGAM|nr:hypothetical protein BJ322DRAFT_775253 [Thelephora terrestris]